MNRAHDELVEFSVVSDKSHSLASPFGTKKAGEHQSVGSEQGTMTPEAICFKISRSQRLRLPESRGELPGVPIHDKGHCWH